MAKKLTDKQKMFVKEYLIDKNATRAYIRAGYSVKDERTAEAAASRLLSNVIIKEEINKGLEELAGKLDITAENVLRRIDNLAKVCEDPNSELFNPVAAKGNLELLGKHLKLFTDKIDLNLLQVVRKKKRFDGIEEDND